MHNDSICRMQPFGSTKADIQKLTRPVITEDSNTSLPEKERDLDAHILYFVVILAISGAYSDILSFLLESGSH